MSTKFILAFLAFSTALLATCCSGGSLVPPGSTGPKVTTTTSATKPNFTCKCENTYEPLCANNGVTYQNKCRFDCAKHKVERLRIFKEGDCGKYISKTQFWSFG